MLLDLLPGGTSVVLSFCPFSKITRYEHIHETGRFPEGGGCILTMYSRYTQGRECTGRKVRDLADARYPGDERGKSVAREPSAGLI